MERQQPSIFIVAPSGIENDAIFSETPSLFLQKSIVSGMQAEELASANGVRKYTTVFLRYGNEDFLPTTRTSSAYTIKSAITPMHMPRTSESSMRNTSAVLENTRNANETNAMSGIKNTTMPIILVKSAFASSKRLFKPAHRSPSAPRASPKKTETNSTCSIAPFATGVTMFLGMMSIRSAETEIFVGCCKFSGTATIDSGSGGTLPEKSSREIPSAIKIAQTVVKR